MTAQKRAYEQSLARDGFWLYKEQTAQVGYVTIASGIELPKIGWAFGPSVKFVRQMSPVYFTAVRKPSQIPLVDTMSIRLRAVPYELEAFDTYWCDLEFDVPTSIKTNDTQTDDMLTYFRKSKRMIARHAYENMCTHFAPYRFEGPSPSEDLSTYYYTEMFVMPSNCLKNVRFVPYERRPFGLESGILVFNASHTVSIEIDSDKTCDAKFMVAANDVYRRENRAGDFCLPGVDVERYGELQEEIHADRLKHDISPASSDSSLKEDWEVVDQ